MSTNRRAVGVTVAGTTASVLPAFLTGAVAVQLSDDLGLSDTQLGLAIGAFFATAATGSALLGRVAERLGPARAMRTGLVVTVASQVAVVLGVRSFGTLALALAVGGLANALTQPAANLLLAGRLPAGRLGIAMALKQSGMPLASLLGGIAVPLLAVTVGWRAAYVAGGVLAVVMLAAVPADPPDVTARTAAGAGARPDLPLRVLQAYALAGLLGAAAAGVIVSFIVTAAEASGIPEAPAGLLLTAGSLLGVCSRLWQGRAADRGVDPLPRVALLLTVGAAGLLVMAAQTPVTYLVGVVPAFVFGWSWPGLFNLSVIQRNPSAPAAATGVTQTGVYVGAGAGPALGGVLADSAGYGWLWAAAAMGLAGAAVVAVRLAARGRPTTTDRPRPDVTSSTAG